MPFDPPFAVDLSQWLTLLIALAIGLGAALAVFLVGRLMTRATRQSADDINLNPRPDSEEEDADVFLHGSTMDRRRSLRRGGNPVAVEISDSSSTAQPLPGYVLDRSTGGLCLSLAQPYAQGTLLTVRPATAPQTVPWVQVEVRNCRQVGRDYEMGCKFVKTPPWSVLLLFG